jgi:hypothetical protein
MKFATVQKFLFNNIDSILIACAGFVFILLLAKYGGIGISPDSVTYASVAKNLVAHGKFIEYDEMPYVDFPIGYPVFLSSFFKFFGDDYVHFGVYINALLFAVLILMCGLAMNRFTYTSRLYKIAILLCIILSPGLLEVYSMLWSETLFIFLAVVFMLILHKYLNTLNASALIAAALIAATICIVRYAGICVIGMGGFVLLFMKHRSTKQKIIHILLFGAIACSLLAFNLIRNFYALGYLTGEREKSLTSLWGNFKYFGITLYDWLPYAFNHYLPETIFGLIVVLLLAIAVVWHLVTKKDNTSFEYVAAVFAFGYISFMILTATVSRFEPLNSRLFSPAFIPMLWVFAYRLNKTVIVSKGWKRFLFISFNVFIAVFFICNEFILSYGNYTDIKDYGIPGYTDDDWRLSPTVKYIQSKDSVFRSNYDVYSNANDAVFFFTGRSTQRLPHRQSPDDIKEFLQDDHFYIVWFTLGFDSDIVALKDILRNKRMRLVKQFSDGAVYMTIDPDMPAMQQPAH